MKLHLATCAFGLRKANVENVYIFAASIVRHLPTAKVTIFTSETDLSTIPGNVTLVPVTPEAGSPILTRWDIFRRWLPTIDPDEIVMLVDSRDVVFNADPTPAILAKFDPARPMLFSEHQTTGSHSWCAGQAKLMESLSSGSHAMDVPEINGGCIVGAAKVLGDLAGALAWACGLLGKTRISDQPILNRWARQNQHVLMEDRALYCHGELVKVGRWEGPDPRTVAIFHQFDRIPAHRVAYVEEYLRPTPATVQPTPATVPRKEVVVAHFREDLSKLQAWLPDLPTVIYSKGADDVDGAVRLPNVGFEANTFLHHFATNFDRLAEVTVCLQANPFDHFRKEANAIRDQIISIDPANFSFVPLAPVGHGAAQGRDGSPHHKEIAGDLEDLWRKLFGYAPPDRWFAWYAGQFAVHRDLVRRRPREWWAQAAKLIDTKKKACVIERAWGTIFA